MASHPAKERKRAADREAQRQNRARTKAYITHLEKTVQDLSGQGQDQLGQRLIEQQERISQLEETLQKIDHLIHGNGATNSHLPSSGSSQTRGDDIVTEQASAQPPPNDFFGIDLVCSDRERNFLEVLGSAFTMVQGCSSSVLGPLAAMPACDDDFCIRAVVDGWKSVTTKYHADVVWRLLQAVDEGLFYRSDPVTRIALLRMMRAMLLQRMCVPRKPCAVPDYMLASRIQNDILHQPFLDFFPWPHVRDHWIQSGTEYASESCASLFATSVRFQWPFDLRDVFRRTVSTDMLSFSHEFDARYYDINSWQLDVDEDSVRWAETYSTLALPIEGILELSHDQNTGSST